MLPLLAVAEQWTFACVDSKLKHVPSLSLVLRLGVHPVTWGCKLQGDRKAHTFTMLGQRLQGRQEDTHLCYLRMQEPRRQEDTHLCYLRMQETRKTGRHTPLLPEDTGYKGDRKTHTFINQGCRLQGRQKGTHLLLLMVVRTTSFRLLCSAI